MVRELLFLVALAVLSYATISIYIGSVAEVGTYGSQLASTLELLFGNTIYLVPLFLFYALYKTYKTEGITKKRIEIALAFLLTLFALITLEALATGRSLFGTYLIETLEPFVGKVGVVIFALFLIFNSWLLAFSLSIGDIMRFLAKKFPQTHLFDHWVTFKEATKESFSDMLMKKTRELEEIPAPKATQYRADPVVIDNYVRQKQQEILDDYEDDIDIEPSDKRRIAVLEASGWKVDERKNDVKIVKELEENKRLLDQVEKGTREKPKDFMLPPLEFLATPPAKKSEVNETEIDEKIAFLLEKLRMFKIDGDVVRTYTGPVVTTFEFKPAPHIKVSRILNLEDDIAMALRAQTIRIQAPIPGKDVVGIEIPNASYETIYLKDILESEVFKSAASPLTIALGKDIVGNPFITDLKKLPHLLIAGTTGSGKSVGINAMILSLLYRNSPQTLRIIMIDPKMLEFSIYNGIPHLLTPVITKPKQAIAALANTVLEMERRNMMMSKTRTKNIENYNEKAKIEGFEPMPFIVVIIDELADLMMTGGKEVEFSIARLAQMARASGIHLIVATQRPSVDVITGLIKANLPSRASYRVGSKVDSKVILDALGADSLLGRGDMLFTPPGSVGLVRLHAPFSSEKEIEKVVEFLKDQQEAEYDESFLVDGGDLAGGSSEKRELDEELDELYEEAKGIVLSERKSSISYIQRRLQIGYNRAARIVEQLEKMGVLSEQNSKGQREII